MRKGVVMVCCVSCGLALDVGRRAPNCADGWEGFAPDRPLNASQVVHKPKAPHSFADFKHGSPYQGLFLDPSSKFAFCTIEKNGCSAWNTVLNKIWMKNAKVENKKTRVSHMSYERWGSSWADNIFLDSQAQRAVMIRDPLARLVSAFLNKCFSLGCTNPYCFPRNKTDRSHPISFKAAVDWMLTKDPAKIDGHWKLQSEHCELKDRVSEFTVLGFMDKDRFAADAACIMERAGLSEFNDDGTGNRFFVQGSEGVNPTMEGRAKEESVLKRLYTPEAARQIMKHMQQDYEVFNMEEPAWVAEATGEWYARVPSTCNSELRTSSARKTGLGAHLGSLLEEDDVFAGAEQAGYFE